MESDFCRHCGAGIPPREGEGRCWKCDPEVQLKICGICGGFLYKCNLYGHIQGGKS